MEVKVCSRCKEEKVLDEFNRHKSRKDGYDSQCRACDNEKSKRYREENPKKVREYNKRYYEENKDNVNENNKRYREANKEKINEKSKRYNENNKEKIKEYKKSYREANPEKVKSSRKKYYEENKEKVREYSRRYVKKRRQEDELYKIKISTRNVIRCALRRQGYTKKSRTYEILGCRYEEFKVHIESMFKDGMSWENYGDWHLDHIIPVSYGLNEAEVMALNHFSNFQPLWAEENLLKGNRYIG